jgi:hypothetical protein
VAPLATDNLEIAVGGRDSFTPEAQAEALMGSPESASANM